MAAISLISKWTYKLLTSGLKPDANADSGNQGREAGVVDNVLTYTHDADGNRTQRAAPAWQVDYT